jgi:hypothetical protein
MPAYSRIGIICPPDHAVFGPVARGLRDRGHQTVFFEPGVEVDHDRLDSLDVLVNKKVRWESLQALEYAYHAGIPAWNGFVGTSLFLNRLSQLAVLSAAGFPVPEARLDKPETDYVAKGFLDIHDDPSLDGEGDFYEPLLDFDGTDYKYYAVDDGQEIQVAVARFESKLFGEREFLGRGTVDSTVGQRINRLLRCTGVSGLGVDLIDVDGTMYAIDANPATSFRRTGLETAIVESIETLV